MWNTVSSEGCLINTLGRFQTLITCYNYRGTISSAKINAGVLMMMLINILDTIYIFQAIVIIAIKGEKN